MKPPDPVTWHETAARWGATSAGLLAIGALVAAIARRLRDWVFVPWWTKAFLTRVDALSAEIGMLSQAVANLQHGLVNAAGVPLRIALDDHLTDAARRLGDIDVAVHEVNARLDACMIANHRPRRED